MSNTEPKSGRFADEASGEAPAPTPRGSLPNSLGISDDVPPWDSVTLTPKFVIVEGEPEPMTIEEFHAKGYRFAIP